MRRLLLILLASPSTKCTDLNTIQATFKRCDSQWNDAQVAQFIHSYVQSITSVGTCFQREEQVQPTRYPRISDIGTASICRKSSLRMGKLSRCYVKTLWVPRYGFTSSYTKHSKTTNQYIIRITFLSCDLSGQENP